LCLCLLPWLLLMACCALLEVHLLLQPHLLHFLCQRLLLLLLVLLVLGPCPLLMLEVLNASRACTVLLLLLHVAC
jgi:hypothetical protein